MLISNTCLLVLSRLSICSSRVSIPWRIRVWAAKPDSLEEVACPIKGSVAPEISLASTAARSSRAAAVDTRARCAVDHCCIKSEILLPFIPGIPTHSPAEDALFICSGETIPSTKTPPPLGVRFKISRAWERLLFFSRCGSFIFSTNPNVSTLPPVSSK